MTELDALFFAAHPDDAELCCGGTIAALIKEGKKAGIIDLTKGELGTRGSVNLRKKESERASKVLGISVRENLGIADGNIQNTPVNRLKVIKAIRKYRPKVIFFPHYYDRHPDHYNTHILVKEAAFYSGLCKIITKGFEAYRPKRSFYYMQSYTFEPNVIMDITAAYDTKIKAVKCYSSQFFSGENKKSKDSETFISSKSFMEYIEARSRFYGFTAGVKYGEAFYTEEKIKLNPHTLFKI
ncbi:MAG: bacillithiol biosynthesis deacetylase BshB1 [Ignavibacteria bacterium]